MNKYLPRSSEAASVTTDIGLTSTLTTRSRLRSNSTLAAITMLMPTAVSSATTAPVHLRSLFIALFVFQKSTCVQSTIRYVRLFRYTADDSALSAAYADTGTQEHMMLRSPYALSTLPTGGQYFCRFSDATGNAAVSR